MFRGGGFGWDGTTDHLRPYLNRSSAESAVGGHPKGKRNYTLEFHAPLSLELLHYLTIDAGKDSSKGEQRLWRKRIAYLAGFCHH